MDHAIISPPAEEQPPSTGGLTSRLSCSSLSDLQDSVAPTAMKSLHSSLLFEARLRDEYVGSAVAEKTMPIHRRSRSSDEVLVPQTHDLIAPTAASKAKSSSSLDGLEPASNQEGLRRRRGVSMGKQVRIRHASRGDRRRRSLSPQPTSKWVIPLEHPFKVLWDIFTIILSIANAYATHTAIRDRKMDGTFLLLCDIWFAVDILLNFVTEKKTDSGETLRDPKSICARYLTTWFAVDALSVFPWERIYVQPLIEIQKRRGLLQKYFFRSKAVIRVTSHLRGRHFRWFGQAARHTKQHGIGASRLLRLLIKYIPKYLLFVRNMKGAVALRLLRQVNWFRRFWRNIVCADDVKSDAETHSLTTGDGDDLDDFSHDSNGIDDPDQEVEVDWECMDDDENCDEDDDEDDGVPL